MNNPVYISVVLSTYNDEKYISESIRSILNQTYPYFEFIIVNDGSTDSTLDIIKSFDDNRIVLIDKQNTGLIDSLNTGVRAAQYEWVARMDGDDISEPNRFEEQIKHINENVTIISSQCVIIDSEGKQIGKTKFLNKGIGKSLSLALGLPLTVHPAVMFRKDAFQQVGGYDKNMLIAEDYDLWCKMLKHGKLYVTSERLLRLRKHGDNISIQKNALQRLNDTIGYVKKVYSLHRCLDDSEYNLLSELVKNAWFYRKIYDRPDTSTLYYLYKQVVRYFSVRFDCKLRKAVRHITR